MEIITIGINHKSAPIEVREKLYMNSTQQDFLLSELKSNPAVIEAFVLSTCNRVEIYANVINECLNIPALIKLVFCIKKMPAAKHLEKYFYKHHGREAVRHLFEVSTGLDSLVIGEDQILGQVKIALKRSGELGMLGRYFNVLANTAIRVGKKARNETRINFGGTSISWAAVRKAEDILGSLQKRSILIIGAGEMSELAVGHIQNKQFKKLFVMNRTQDNAQGLAKRYGGEAVPFCDIKEILGIVDICMCSAGAPHYLIEKDIVARVMAARGNKPLVFIDISMPRNIDPRIADIACVLLFKLDDLQEVVRSTLSMRQKAIQEVHEMISLKLEEFQAKVRKLHHIEHGNFPSFIEVSDQSRKF